MMKSKIGEKFLARFAMSREECHAVAKSLSSSDNITTLAVQGANSYSVRAGQELVVQFRTEPVDLRVQEQAMMIHGSKYIVPITLQQSQPVYVYSCPYRGKTYCEQGILRVSIVAQKITLADLGAFFAQSCYHTKSVMDVKLETIEKYLKDCLNLPDIRHKVQFLLDNLAHLAELPIVLVHDDLGSLNILSDDDGNVTGILDWSGSQYLPFGWNLYGVEEFLGFMRIDGWVNRKERDELEEAFWKAFWEKTPLIMTLRRESLESAIYVARGIGLLWRNVGPHGVADMLENYPQGLTYLKALL